MSKATESDGDIAGEGGDMSSAGLWPGGPPSDTSKFVRVFASHLRNSSHLAPSGLAGTSGIFTRISPALISDFEDEIEPLPALTFFDFSAKSANFLRACGAPALYF